MSIKADVDRGIEIKILMIALKKELEEIEARLEKAGLEGDQVELNDADREGRQFLAHGTDRIVPVIFTADSLRGEFMEDSKAHVAIKAAAGDHFNKFYKPARGFKNRFESGKKFRALAAELLDDKAPAFITACLSTDKHGIPKSSVKTDWDRAQVKGVA